MDDPRPARRCTICGSPEHTHRGGPIFPDGYRRDYEPGKHDPKTGEEVKR